MKIEKFSKYLILSISIIFILVSCSKNISIETGTKIICTQCGKEISKDIKKLMYQLLIKKNIR